MLSGEAELSEKCTGLVCIVVFTFFDFYCAFVQRPCAVQSVVCRYMRDLKVTF